MPAPKLDRAGRAFANSSGVSIEREEGDRPVKITFQNNSVSGINRRYRTFLLDIPGRTEKTIEVPDNFVADVTAYLKKNHPAVVVQPVQATEPDTEDPQPDGDNPQPESDGEDSGADNPEGGAPAQDQAEKPSKKRR
jgi:hypothetical protein